VAVIAAVLGAPDPERAAREIRDAMDGTATAHP
jgi:thiamine monophosphate synthase